LKGIAIFKHIQFFNPLGISKPELLNCYFGCSSPDNYGVIKSLVLFFPFMQLKLFVSHVTFAKPKSSCNSSIGKAGKLFLDSFLK